jgi:hypothetical protein
MTQILNWLKTYAATHVGYLVIIGVVLFAGRMYMQEHDARVKADATVKTAHTAIDGLQKQQSVTAQTAKVEVTVLQKQAEAVRTTPEAVAALPSVETQPLNAEIVPDAPSRVAVDAVPLFQELSVCKQCSVKLDAAGKELDLQKQITAQKDVQIAALKKKPGFMTRVVKGLKVVGCAGAGAAAGSITKTAEGAAIGAAAGAGVCQMF